MAGALIAELLSDIVIDGTVVDENEALRAALARLEIGSILTMTNSTVSEHRGDELVWLDDLDELALRHVSIAGNCSWDGASEAFLFDTDGEAPVEIFSSIVLQPFREFDPGGFET